MNAGLWAVSAPEKRQILRSAPPARSLASANEMLVCAPAIKQKPLPPPSVTAHSGVVKATSESVEGLIESLVKGVGEGVGNIFGSPVKGVSSIFGQQESKYLHLTVSKPASSYKCTRDILHTHISRTSDLRHVLPRISGEGGATRQNMRGTIVA